ncbi:MAG TPA: hypothetical protein VK934_10320 [Fimbriimonas sp.]|nr:hypothetical protein [Fimbriimonas sp.]
MIRALFAALAFASAPLQADEVTSLTTAFADAGWKVEQKDLALGKAVVVGSEYVFVFERIGQRFERDLLVDPNLKKARTMEDAGYQLGTVFGSWRDLGGSGVTLATATPPLGLPHPTQPRRLSPGEANALLVSLARSKALRRIYYDANGASVEGMPPATSVAEAWGFGDFYTLKVKNARFASIGEEPFLLRTRGEVLSLMYGGPEDGASLPLHSGFAEVRALCAAAKVGALWNAQESDAEVAGEWFRKRLSTPWLASLWEPVEVERLVKVALTNAEEAHGIVFARSGEAGVAFFYDESGEAMIAEFVGEELQSTKTVTDASLKLEQTDERDVWNAYEVVCRQFAHPLLVLGLYRNEAMRG